MGRAKRRGAPEPPAISSAVENGTDVRRVPDHDERLKRVLRVAAEQAGYGQKLGPREGIGLAVHRSFNDYPLARMGNAPREI